MSREVKERLETSVKEALKDAFGEPGKQADAMLTPATRPEFGDYQCNAALPLAKKMHRKPRDVALELFEKLNVKDICEEPAIAGVGFINLTLKKEFVASRLEMMLSDPDRLGVAEMEPIKIIVDFSSPNIAKEMHVGHLRSTIIGESLARTLEFLGRDVLRLNHVGDWGTQFGLLILYLKEAAPEALTTEGQVDLGDLVEFYKKASKRSEEDPAFRENARSEVVKLQAGDPQSTKAWNLICDQSRREFQKLYDMLGVTIVERGESFYNPFLSDVVTALEEKGLAAIDDGATVVYLDKYKNAEGKPQPLIVRKRGGGFLYSTTDLAAIRHRTSVEGATRVLYVTDAGQGTHFDQVFQVARKAEFCPLNVSLEHVPFGLVLGEDGKKLKTRSGDTIKLKLLLDESIVAGEAEFRRRLAEENREEPEDYIQHVAQVIGLSAVKYADLKNLRTSDYRFSFKRMLALEGNTAPYMLYTYARIQGILRKLGSSEVPESTSIELIEPQESVLGRALIRLPEMLADVEKLLRPHLICDYLFELSSHFNSFYQKCSILNAELESVKNSRLALAVLTARVVKLCLHLLGIPVLNRM
eukprot:Plantae.Rhodophyta-Purpureofilum_apyrenoidigerum.ctg3915.p1 GENE.Plantae.Rhodophyta-Purpureofilum_apyrenoidigerum.ctg3915~~Plantae.Rhodophyta-Purpureofilum_apyrenoidigerum.ctg3915.p1  ORF type:complete len:586 (+),score=125.65 Plantae.Rhodophyta-Purpureofilum_apyrenoidigerum.ctg3915:133-1890(+)